MKNTTNLSDGEKTPQERNNLDLLQLCLELYARSGNQPNNKKMHDYAFEAISELKKRLSVSNEELTKENEELKAEMEMYREKYTCNQSTVFNQKETIAKLTARLSECEKANEWVSVEDRLPEKGSKFLGYSGGTPNVYIYETKAVFKLWEITYWMPLPSPPNPNTH